MAKRRAEVAAEIERTRRAVRDALRRIWWSCTSAPSPASPCRADRRTHAERNDAAWLRVELARGQTVAHITRPVGADGRDVAATLRRFRITVPPRRMSPLDRAAALPAPAERVRDTTHACD